MATELTGVPADLHRYLQQARDSLMRALDGLGEYDIRRPLTPTGTNLLGLVKHLAGVELGYLVESVGRPAPSLAWNDDGSVWDSADMWATADQSRDELTRLYHQAWELSDASLAAVPLDAPAEVDWWPAHKRHTTFGHLVVRVVAETAQHAGHAEILRELVDGQAGRDHDHQGDAAWWAGYLARIQAAADAYADVRPPV
ncbi:MAG TPA: DinB family protein [Pedococcus sp.]|jgi:hypothetical protein|nr:DinB family protein [Pedococcus sp.]